MKKTFILCLLFSFSLLLNQKSIAQTVKIVEKLNKTDWFDLMQDPNAKFADVQKAFHLWLKANEKRNERENEKHDKKFLEKKSGSQENGEEEEEEGGSQIFYRWEYINQFRVLPDGKLQVPEHIMKEFNKYMAKQVGINKSATGMWTIEGPNQYFTNNTTQPTGMGRINAIAFHPTDPNTVYIGSPSGGIWKTTNNGGTWENLANNLPKLGVSSILINPNDPNIIYIGTGDRDASDAPGIGVFKSIDGGSSWTQMNNGMGNVIVGDMLMLPSNPNTILAATSGGIFKTTNGGATWSLKSGANNYKDIQFKPGDPTIVYATRITTPSKFYRSTNTGDTWTQITSGIPTTGIGSRMVIGTSPANPSYVYLVQINATGGTFAGLLRSTDAGLNFTTQSTAPNIFDYACDGSGTASQATYDLCINVDPNNVNTLYVGSINTWKSIDGGVTWNSSTNWNATCGGTATAVHADHHVLEWNPLNGGLYLGHDGGITYTANGGTSWTEITGGLPITQIYKLGQGASNNNYTVFGCQDNGCGATMDGSNFHTVNGGDGGECIIDYANSNYCYDTYVQGSIRRSSTGPLGSYSNIAANGTNGIDETAAWITPYILHKTDHLTMFAGYNNVWRSNNITSSPPTWTKISTGEISVCEVIEQSSADPGVVYVVRSGSLKRTDNANATASSVTWTACTLPDGITPTYLTTHPTNANIVYATAGNSVYKSVNKGMTWTDMDPNFSLPDLFTNCLVFDKNSNEGLYMGNQTGVWYKNATMTDWTLFSAGLPPVDVRELEIFYDPTGTQNRLKAATYGRGLWQTDLKETGVLNPTNFTATLINVDKIDLNWTPSSGNNVMLAYSTSPTFGTPVDGTSYAALSTIPGGGTVLYNGNATLFNHINLLSNTTYYYKLWSFDGSTIYSTGTTANATTISSLANFTFDASLSCTGSLTVNFTDASIGAYNSWAWDVDNNGTTDYTTQNPVHTYSAPGLYSVKLTINNGLATITKDKIILVMNSSPTVNTGCTLTSNSNSGNGYGIGISRFALGNIDNSTSGNDGYYQNYACSNWTTLELNTAYNATIRTGTYNNEGAKVFIDYNDNGIFDAAEAVVTFPSNIDGLRTVTFTTPTTGVVLNKGLRLRVLSKFSGVPSAGCDVSSYGQAEDYTVYFNGNSISTGSINNPLCQGAAISVPISLTGTYNTGNVFTAQLSDASGSFASPVVIGSYTGTTAGTISAIIPSSAVYGTGYRIRVISSNPAITGSVNSTNITINVNPVPVITGTLAFCAGGSTNLNAGLFNNYLWSNGSTTQTINVTIAGTYLVTVTDANGCSATSPSVITMVNPLPTPVITGNLTFCAGGSTSLNAGSFTNYHWSTGATTQTILVTTAVSFTVNVTDIHGCTAVSSPVTTAVNPLPTPSISGTLSFCSGSSTTLDAGSYSGYKWSTAATTQNIPVNSAGTYTVTVTDGNGCTAASAPVTTIVNPLPTPSISGTLSFCSGSSTTLDAGSYSGYKWSTAATTQNIPVNSAGTYTVTVTDGNGCTAASAPVTTIVNPLPTPAISGTLSFCSGSSTILDAGSYSGYNWSTSATTQNIPVNSSGTYTVTVTDGNGCTAASAPVTTIVNPLPTPAISGNLSFCSGSPTTLNAGSFTAYLWSTNAATQTIQVNTSGIYTVTVTDGNGCTAASAPVITVATPLVTPTFTQLGPYVQGSTAGTLQLTSTNGVTGTWSPAVVNTAALGQQTYTFTPAAGQCANAANMTIQILSNNWIFMGDIGTTINITWPSTANAANYTLQYRPYGSSAPWIGIGSTTSSVKVTNLLPGTHYEFIVRAYLASGSPIGVPKISDYSTTSTSYAKTQDMGTTCQENWDDYTPWASSYVLQYKKTGAPSWTNLPCYVPNSKIATEPGIPYVSQVIVYHAGLYYGTTALFPFTPNAYSNSIANNTGTSLDLTWTNFDLNNPAPWIVGAGSTQYLRYRVAGSTAAWIQKTVAGGINTYHLTGLTVNTNYEFMVSVYLPAFWGSSPLAYFTTNTAIKNSSSDITNHCINIYPNPFFDKVNMDLFAEKETTVFWSIYDMTGKIVLSGSQHITNGYSTLNINAANLLKGVYMLNAIVDDQMQNLKIYKQ